MMNKRVNNTKDLGSLVLQEKLFEKEGVADNVDKTHLERHYNNKTFQASEQGELGIGGGTHST